MGDRSTSSGVKNILAMFESKHEETSPPSRGRSPADGSEGVRSNSSRPVSKIRASFVAVEGSGHMGPALGLRKLSNTMESESGEGDAKRPEMTSDARAKSSLNGSATIGGSPRKKADQKKRDVAASAKPESVGQKDGKERDFINGSAKKHGKVASTKIENNAPEVTHRDNDGGLGAVLKGSPFEPLPGEKTQTRKTQKQTPNSKTTDPTPKPNVTKPTGKPSGDTTAAFKFLSEPKPSASRPGVITTTASSTSSRPAASTKEPKPSKTPTTPTTTAFKDSKPEGQGKFLGKAPKPTLREPTKGPIRKTSRQSLASQKDVDKKHKPITSNSGPATAKKAISTAKPQSGSPTISVKKQTQHTQGGFVKPPPKSPTRPVRLPASATAQTAASSAKLGRKSLSPSRAGHSGHALKAPASKAGAPSSGTSSTASRASLGGPTYLDYHTSSRDRNISKTSDGDFLSRMMRPTASSSSKIFDRQETAAPVMSKVAARMKIRPKSEPGETEEQKENNDTAFIDQGGVTDAVPAETSHAPSEAVPESQPRAGASEAFDVPDTKDEVEADVLVAQGDHAKGMEETTTDDAQTEANQEPGNMTEELKDNKETPEDANNEPNAANNHEEVVQAAPEATGQEPEPIEQSAGDLNGLSGDVTEDIAEHQNGFAKGAIPEIASAGSGPLVT